MKILILSDSDYEEVFNDEDVRDALCNACTIGIVIAQTYAVPDKLFEYILKRIVK